MRLATFIPPGGGPPRAGDVQGDEVVSFPDGITVEGLIASGDRPSADGERFQLADVELLAPYIPRVTFGIGLNFQSHLDEINEIRARNGMEPQEKESSPMIFLKGPASVVGPSGPVVRPRGIERLDYEGELAIVIGPGNTIAGYAVADDICARDIQEWQLTFHKGGDTFCPWGPWITTADEVSDPYDLRIRTWVDGDLRQDSTTAEMIHRFDAMIYACERTIRLRPGDMMITGTPRGVGLCLDPPQLLETGQKVRIEIDGLGFIEHEVVDEEPADAPLATATATA